MAPQSKSAKRAKTSNSLLVLVPIAVGLISVLALFVDISLRDSVLSILGLQGSSSPDIDSAESPSDVCSQVPALFPSNRQVEQFIRDKVESAEYRTEIVDKLSGIVQIPSESYDELGPIGEDSRWDVFYQIEEYLKARYPTVFETVKLDHANTHGLILTWQGSAPVSEAKPILMLAHQDVVPVLADTVQDWTHPPYDGYYDGEIVWGRGATDDKGYLISIIESVDLLIKSGFQPKRTVILAFGCDEEISGENCGRPIADFLYGQYGKEGIYLIMDEGSVGLQQEFNQSFAMVSVAEKGYLDVGINVTSTGGHASNPPEHNVIGIISEIITEIENNSFPGRVTATNPMFGFLQCAATYAPESSFLKQVKDKLGKVARGNQRAQAELAKLMDNMRYYFRTSQSVGKIHGGVKINAIPETVSTMINLRLAVESSILEIETHYENLVKRIAEKHQMAFEGFNSLYESLEPRKISLFGIDPLEPAPVSPVDAEAFQILSGTIRSTLKPLNPEDELIVTPYLMPANTDTKFFWQLTRNIYRFTPINLVENLNRAHTTNEFIRADELVREPLFFATLILNADDAVVSQ